MLTSQVSFTGKKEADMELTHDHMPGLLGGVLCLDFVNTVDSWGANPPNQHLEHYVDLVCWGWYVGILNDEQAQQLAKDGAQRPAESQRIFAEAISLRDASHRVFAAIAHGETPQSSDLDMLHVSYTHALQQARLVPTQSGYQWEWENIDTLDSVIWPIAKSAIDLLTSPEIARVKECANTIGCGWLFLDRSKNGSRRWCSMDDCGSRDKMRQYYARRHNPRESK
jgi:predicted RNA-binding Zn ribbon-like protein